MQETFIDSGILPGMPEWSGVFENQAGIINTGDAEFVPEPAFADYGDFFANVYSAIRDGEELIVKPGQARDVICTIELALKSYREKRVVDFVS